MWQGWGKAVIDSKFLSCSTGRMMVPHNSMVYRLQNREWGRNLHISFRHVELYLQMRYIQYKWRCPIVSWLYGQQAKQRNLAGDVDLWVILVSIQIKVRIHKYSDSNRMVYFPYTLQSRNCWVIQSRCHSECGPLASSIGITWQLIRHTEYSSPIPNPSQLASAFNKSPR